MTATSIEPKPLDSSAPTQRLMSVDALRGFLQFFEKTSPNGRSSMQKDVAAGNPPELDAIAGPILRGAQAHGIDVPATRELASMIRGISAAAVRS